MMINNPFIFGFRCCVAVVIAMILALYVYHQEVMVTKRPDVILVDDYQYSRTQTQRKMATYSVNNNWQPYSGTYVKETQDIRTKDGKEYLRCWPNAGEWIVLTADNKAIPNADVTHVRLYDRERAEDPRPTSLFKSMNHHHELTDDHKVVDFGDGQFVANKAAIPLLKALNELGLRTRSHHIEKAGEGWFSLLLDNVAYDQRTVQEVDADRVKYNGKQELMIFFGNATKLARSNKTASDGQ